MGFSSTYIANTAHGYQGYIINTLDEPITVSIMAIDPFTSYNEAWQKSNSGSTVTVKTETIQPLSSVHYRYGDWAGQMESALIYPTFKYKHYTMTEISPQAGGDWIVYQKAHDDIEVVHRF